MNRRVKRAGVKFQKRRRQLKGKLQLRKHTYASNTMVSYINNKLMLPFPQRYRTKIHQSLQGYWSAGYANNYDATNPTVSVQQFITVRHNGIYRPFNNLSNQNIISGSAPTAFFLDQTANPYTTDSPIGYGALSAIYQAYRVYSCAIKVCIEPESIVDTMNVAVIPSFENNFYTTSANQSLTALAQMPFARSKVIQCNTGDNTIKTHITQHKLLGVKYRAIEDDLSGQYESFTAANPQQAAYYNIAFSTQNGQPLVNRCGWKIDCTWYVEFYEPQSLAI